MRPQGGCGAGRWSAYKGGMWHGRRAILHALRRRGLRKISVCRYVNPGSYGLRSPICTEFAQSRAARGYLGSNPAAVVCRTRHCKATAGYPLR